MTTSSRKKQQIVLSALAACGVVGVSLPALHAFADPGKKMTDGDKGRSVVDAKATKGPVRTHPLTEDEKIVHVLNRLGFGPRPGDVEKVRAMGLERYINQQLMPESIPDAALDQKLAAYPSLQLSSAQLSEMYQSYQEAYRQARTVRKELTSRAAQADAKMALGTTPADGGAPALGQAQKAKKNLMADATPQERQDAMTARQDLAKASQPVLQAQTQFVDSKMLRAVESERQFQEVLVDFWGNHFNIDIRKQPCAILKIVDDREVIRPHILGKFRDLLEASAKSPAMLVYLDNFQSTSDMPAANQRNPRLAMRRRALIGAAGTPGQGAVGNPGTGAAAAGAPGQAALAPPKPAKKRGGLNENYAREIMELHTLGVDGGYTQKDVTEVARCLTGWSLVRPGAARPAVAKAKNTQPGEFRFYPALHDNGEKTVLGHVIPAGGGIEDGEKVLEILATHPATMRHISTQLCQRLVSDNPPASLVDKCVATWKRTDGDLREVTRTIVQSPEFFSGTAYRSKIKSPFEYAVSSVRALGGSYAMAETAIGGRGRQQAQVRPPQGGGYFYLNTTSLIGEVGTMGEPLFQYQAPTGYPEESQKWVSSGALISRMNFSLALTAGKITDVKLPNMAQMLPNTKDTSQFIDRFAEQVLHQRLAPATKATLLKEAAAPTTETASAMDNNAAAPRLAALLLGSPEFQRR
ncbi:MAG: hypothetical protein JWL77_317 [Chthonomonadaceae bacterium]|nr:hypothetical protein [Chthonomonadaceae bacterium]